MSVAHEHEIIDIHCNNICVAVIQLHAMTVLTVISVYKKHNIQCTGASIKMTCIYVSLLLFCCNDFKDYEHDRYHTITYTSVFNYKSGFSFINVF